MAPEPKVVPLAQAAPVPATQPAPSSVTRVGFSTPKSFSPLSWLIRTVTGSKTSHAFFVYHDTDFDLEMVMEATEMGFRIIPLKHFERTNRIVKVVHPKHPIDVGLKIVARRYLGSEYDVAGLVGMTAVMVGRFMKRKWRNPFRGSKNVFCSESVILAMKHSPGYERMDLVADSSPQDLYDWFAKLEGS